MRASDIRPRAIDWLWNPYVPFGKVTVLAGAMGQAKSLFTVWLTSEVTRGGLGLDGPAGVVMFSAEDDAADTTVPRLSAAGADTSRVWVESDAELSPADLRQRCFEDGVRLVIVDPITAYYSERVDSWKSQQVRAAIDPLRIVAAECGAAVLLVQHLNRRKEASALDRIADSQGLPQLARTVLIWGPDPRDPDGDRGAAKALTQAKQNLARAAKSATFRIEARRISGGIEAPVLLRGEDRFIGPDDVVEDAPSRNRSEEAADFLRQMLAEGPLDAREAKSRAEAAGFKGGTLDRGREKARVVSEPNTDDLNRISKWRWRLPDTPQKNGGGVGVVGDQERDPGQNTQDTYTTNSTAPGEGWHADGGVAAARGGGDLDNNEPEPRGVPGEGSA